MNTWKKSEPAHEPFMERRRVDETQRLSQAPVATLNATIEEQGKALLRAEVMAEEIGHRVRNSLNAISSLLQLQGMLTSTEDVRAELLAAAGRIAAVGRVQQHVSCKAINESISITKYINQLCTDLTNILGVRVALAVEDAAEIDLPADSIVSLGLIVNEMVTNATKYGATVVYVTFLRCLDGQLELSVSDNGCGLNAGFDPKTSSGFGMRVISTSASHLGGALTYRSLAVGEGAAFAVKFPANRVQ